MTYDSTDEDAARQRGLSPAQLEQIQERFTLTNAQIAELPEGRLAAVLRKLELPDRPRLRAEFQALFEIGDEATIPEGAKDRALRQLDSARARAPQVREVAGIPTGEVISAASLSPPPLTMGAGLAPTGAGWMSLGPGGIGGRTRSIVIDPRDPQRILAGSVAGGVWITVNGGQNWHPVDDRMANLAVACMAIDPTNPDVLYAGTGEGFHNVDALRGAGVFRTVDGTSWSQLTATATPDFHYVNRIAVSNDGTTLLVATSSGIFRCDDAPRAVWTRVFTGEVADVRFHPSDGQRAVAGTSRSGALLFSIDGGRTWSSATRPVAASGRVELTYAIADPATVYASIDFSGGRIWRSTDGGQTYTARDSLGPTGAPASYLGQQGWYDNVIWAGDPGDAGLVIVGGVDLWRSLDGGDSLTRISNWAKPPSAHADHHAIVAHPGYGSGGNRTVFFGNDGGVYRTDDSLTVGSDPDQASGWVNLVNGYAVTQFYGACGNATSGTIVGGAQDNGTLGFRPAAGVSAWAEIFGGDGGYCAADPGDPDVFYGEYVHLEIFRNTDGAASSNQWWDNYIGGSFFNTLTSRWDWKPLPHRIPDSMNRDALFIAPFVIDPNDSSRLLGGGLMLWQTEDAKTPNTDSTGPSWRSVKPSTGSFVSAIAVAAGDSDLAWVGHVDGEVYRSRDSRAPTPVWELVSHQPGSALQPNRMCTRIVIDPRDQRRVYLTFAGYEAANVWRTDDDGGTWNDLAASLPQVPMRSLAIHPRRPSYLYLGTEVGVFTSEDFGATWSPTNEGPTNCAASELFWMNEVLVCATHGRGMFTIDLSHVPDGP
ncbi:MAG TPA: hypothetical protein VGC93_00585 [Thermoanaerobaculia bacterium]